MQGLTVLVIPVLLMLFALAMGKVESRLSGHTASSTADDDAVTRLAQLDAQLDESVDPALLRSVATNTAPAEGLTAKRAS